MIRRFSAAAAKRRVEELRTPRRGVLAIRRDLAGLRETVEKFSGW